MSTAAAQPSFLVPDCPMPFCKGCGHSHVVRNLVEALAKLNLSPKNVCIVSDIGCIGIVDALFESPHTVHTTHGRSTAFATGIELADSVLYGSDLKTVVFIGDGGAMIGLLHLVNAALLNVDVTVLLCNNFLFGMTGGQNSAFSPIDFITPTTPSGNIIPPIDMCKVMMDAHAEFVARKLATDKDLVDIIAAAIEHPGFALVEIVELCTEYGTPRNQLSGNQLRKIVESHGQQFGILKQQLDRSEFGAAYVNKFPKQKVSTGAAASDGFIQQKYRHNLQKKMTIMIAGSAGERIQSAAGIFCEAAVRSHLNCTQKNDNPVTQGTGFSLSEVCCSPEEILFTGIESPDVVIAVSRDGLNELKIKGALENLSSSTIIIFDSSLEKIIDHSNFHQFPFRMSCGKDRAAAGALAFYLTMSNIFPIEVFLELLDKKSTKEQRFFPEDFYASLDKIPSTRGYS